MAILSFNNESFEVDHAVKGANYVRGYNADGSCVISIEGIIDFTVVTYNDTYLSPEACFAEACNEVRYVNGKFVKKDGTEIAVAPAAHNQAASTITAGALGGKVQANASAAASVGNAQVRDIYAGTSDMTAKSSSLTSGTVYFVYE
jgi:hypothetical protein